MQNLFKLNKASMAVFGAIYISTASYAATDIGAKQSGDGGFYVPTFTSQDVKNINEQRKSYQQGDIFSGKPGQVNHVLPNRKPTDVFKFDDSIKGEHVFIVQLTDKPVSTYKGDFQGYPATSPRQTQAFQGGGTFDINSQHVRQYQSLLKQKQNSVVSAAQAKGAQINVVSQYTLANNAIAVRMTQADAEIMATTAGIKKITPSRIFKLNTDRGPDFINADTAWAGETSSGIKAKGEGMVMGIIDTGINTDHPAFAADDGFSANNPLGAGNFLGDCQTDSSLCNDKLIGVYSYDVITSAYNASEFQDNPWQTALLRPKTGEDYNGHGSHTASTAAGNTLFDTPLQTSTGEAVSDGINLPFTFAQTSGVAPRAHIVSYQVCYPGGQGDPYAGCPEEAILAAFEDAIKDGVDVINFSIGGGENFPWEDPIELAFLSAREAGISVAAAAGNAGPYFFSADHTSPWVTTVGATTHDRILSVGNTSITHFEGDGPSYTLPYKDIKGLGFTDAVSGVFVLAENYPDPDPSDGFSAASCNVPFPAGTFVNNEIVVCERGDIARTDKAINVQSGGAGGIVLQNISYSQGLVADNFVIPGINVDSSARYTLKNWINQSSEGMAKGTITATTNDYSLVPEKGNLLAYFSSMGPSRFIDNLVPDLTAPGVNIYAANADDQPFTFAPGASDWTMMSGTSMASPHTAGAMALLKQLHSDWSPAQIQSALMLTANPVKYEPYQDAPALDVEYNFMAGAGAIDVAKAAETGLVMHESVENYTNANPNNGGIVNWLNLPSMVDMNCKSECSWMRTVTATKDGSWSVSAQTKDDGSELTVSPTQFTLRKGESQSIQVTMTVPGRVSHLLEPDEPESPWEGNNDFGIFNGQIILTETGNRSPVLHMPVVSLSVPDDLPAEKRLTVNRNIGSDTFVVNTDNYSDFTPRMYGLVKPTTFEAELDQVGPFLTDDSIADGWHIEAITVPQGTKRLIVEVQSVEDLKPTEDRNPRYQGVNPVITVGLDANNNASFIPSSDQNSDDPNAMRNEFFDELVCQSSSETITNYCDFIDPVPGTYWIAVSNIGYQEKRHNITTGYALLAEESDKANITLNGPSTHDGNGDYELTLNWDLADAVPGDTYYGGFDLGNMSGEEGTLGFTSLKLTRGKDALSFDVSQTQARSMDIIDLTINLIPNLESNDRTYDFKLALPQGMRLAPNTLVSNNDAILENLVIDESGMSLSGQQLSTRDIPREYVVTNNLTSQQCRTPLIDEYSTGGYIDLHSFGLQPAQNWYVGGSEDYYDIPMDWLFTGMQQEQFKLYNQDNGGIFRMHPVGAIQFNDAYWVMAWHRGPSFLLESLSPFWRGTFEMNYRQDYQDPWGLTLAMQYAEERPDIGDMLFMEFDNVTDAVTGDQYDYQVMLSPNADFRDNRFEIIFAYDNLGANLEKGAIFVEGFDSPYSQKAGPKDGYLYTMVGFDNLDEVLSDDLVMCFDYQGPEASAIELKVKAVIQPEAVGQVMDITMDYTIGDDAGKSMVHSIDVPSNIKLAALPDLTIEENGTIEDIKVIYVDANKVGNTLVVTGDNVEASVEGNSFSLSPAAHFSGETLVTVTVHDNEHVTDSSSTSFMLTVTPINDAPEAKVASASISANAGSSITLDASASVDIDGDSLSFTWKGPGTIANADQAVTTVTELSVGSHEFTVTVSDGQEQSSAKITVTVAATQPTTGTETETDNDSGGSLGWFALMLLSLAAMNRRQSRK